MQIFDILSQRDEILSKLPQEISLFIDDTTLIINDTRGMILPSVLPYIEFVSTYDQRILSMIENTNIILTSPFEKEVLDYYQNFGLSKNIDILLSKNDPKYTLAKNISLDRDLLEKIKGKKYTKILPFFVNDDMDSLSQILNIPLSISKEIFHKANDKLQLKKFLLTSGLPTLDGEFSNKKEVLKKYFDSNKRYLFKDPLGVSGYGFWDNTLNTFDEMIENFGGKELIIEEYIEKISSPSVQFFIQENKKSAYIFGMTDQILENGTIYIGNSSPSEYLTGEVGKEIIRQSREIIQYISQVGYHGFGGIDFIIDAQGKVFATEVNARFTGATYPAITSMKLKNSLTSKWKFYNYDGESQSVSSYLKEKSIEGKDETGVFPLGISGIETYGKANILEFL